MWYPPRRIAAATSFAGDGASGRRARSRRRSAASPLTCTRFTLKLRCCSSSMGTRQESESRHPVSEPSGDPFKMEAVGHELMGDANGTVRSLRAHLDAVVGLFARDEGHVDQPVVAEAGAPVDEGHVGGIRPVLQV